MVRKWKRHSAFISTSVFTYLYVTAFISGFHNMKWLGVFLLLPGGDASPLQVTPNIKFASTHIYTWVKSRVKCLDQEQNTLSLARAPTWSVRSGGRHNSDKITVPLQREEYSLQIFCITAIYNKDTISEEVLPFHLESWEHVLEWAKLRNTGKHVKLQT